MGKNKSKKDTLRACFTPCKTNTENAMTHQILLQPLMEHPLSRHLYSPCPILLRLFIEKQMLVCDPVRNLFIIGYSMVSPQYSQPLADNLLVDY